MRSLLYLSLVCYCFEEQLLSATSATNGLKGLQGAFKDAAGMMKKAEPTLASRPQTKTGHRIVTDVKFGGHKLAEIIEDEISGDIITCNLLGDRWLIEQLIKAVQEVFITDVTTDEMNLVVDRCQEQPSNTTEYSLLGVFGTRIHSVVMFPGTKWCGPGHVAAKYDDVGKSIGTDRCCRDHDHSLDSIPAFGSKHGLQNPKFYTMTDCADDTKFFRCLLNDGSAASITVGTIFFDVLKTKCFDYGYVTKCAQIESRFLQRKTPCIDTEEDPSRRKEWRIVTSPSFFKTYLDKTKLKGAMEASTPPA